MSFQQLIAQKNLDISIVELKDLEECNRIDPEYYRPIFLLAARKPNSKPIGDILTMCEYGLSIAMNEEGVGRKILRMNDLVNGVVVNDDLKYADITDKEYEKYKVVKNDILFNRVNSIDFVGRTGIFKGDIADSVFASYLIRIRTNEEVEPDFLNIFLNCKIGKLEILRKARRAVNQANVNAEELKRIKLPIAKKEFQNEITRLSNQSFEKREQSKFLYHQAEQLLLKELRLENYQPTEDNISIKNSGEVGIFSRMDAEFFQPKYDEIVEKIVKVKTDVLEDIVDYKKGIEPGSDAYTDDENGVPFVRVSDVSINGIDRIEKRISSELAESYKGAYSPRKGEVLLTKDGTIGTSLAITEDMNSVLSGAFLRLQPKIKIEQEYLALVLNSIVCKLQIERFSGGALIEHLKPGDLMQIKVPILDQSIQQKIADLITQSHQARNESKKLLDVAKRAVEVFIEEDEEKAMEFISKSI